MVHKVLGSPSPTTALNSLRPFALKTGSNHVANTNLPGYAAKLRSSIARIEISGPWKKPFSTH